MNDSTKKLAQELLADPLSSETRSAKKSMLALASLSCLMNYTGVVPEDVDVLGFKFPGLTSSTIRWALLLLFFYSYITSGIYLLADYRRHKILADRYNLAVASELYNAFGSEPTNDFEEHLKGQDENLLDEFRQVTGYREKNVSPAETRATNFARTALDFFFPMLFGFGCLIYFFCKLP